MDGVAVVVVPAAEEQVHAGPAQERGRVHDGVHRRAERVGAKPAVPSGQADAVDHPDELGEVVIGPGPLVVPAGLEAVGAAVLVGRPVVLPPAVVAAGAGPVFQRRAADVAAVGLVQVAAVVLAEMVGQEALIHLLDDREQAVVGRVEGELGVGVPGRGRARRRVPPRAAG